MFVADFQIIRPKFEMPQADTLEWLIEAHVKAEAATNKNVAEFRNTLREKLWHVGCKPGPIEKRGHVLEDFSHLDWDRMKIYALNEYPKGKDLSFRSQIFDREVDSVFSQFYEEISSPPNDLIHVSCTGYVSPSGAQKLVSRKGWGTKTQVTHAYHMGCYGAFPALRMASGFLKERADIVHTEICCLHINPTQHSTDQLVTQSLFADGFIKYSVLKNPKGPHFCILNQLEEIIPDSSQSMTWNVVDWGNQMYLGKEVPVLITRHLAGYLQRLAPSIQNPLFAIHPGGPKILQQIQNLLKLTDAQLAPSVAILKKYGNMSSATIPHVWNEILTNSDIPHQTPIISMAFGPGLSISGNLMVKQCG